MKKFDIIRFAFTNFLRRKARSALTVLGVVIGTAAVVIMLSIGIGMNKGIEDQMSSYGDLRKIEVWEQYSIYNEETDEYSTNENRVPLDDITLEEIRAIDGVKVATPYSQQWYYLTKDGKEKVSSSQLIGIDAASMGEFDYEVLYGRLLDERDVGTTNFVMSYNIPFNFYNPRTDEEKWYVYASKDEEMPFNPIDPEISYAYTWDYNFGSGAIDATKPRIVPEEAHCVGILVRDDANNYGMECYMDIQGLKAMAEKLEKNCDKYYNSEYGSGYGTGVTVMVNGVDVSETVAEGRESLYDEILVMCEDTDDVMDVQEAIADMGLQPNSNMKYLVQQQEQTKFLRSILGAIGVVAFFVAAISIANTMVMSIYERTREIGIMKVIGCKLSDIRGMFLVEAAIIGVVGGVLGVILSYAMSIIVNKLAAGGGMAAFGIYSSEATLSIIPFWLDIAALILAIAVGVISGLYPAIRATRLSALDAIRNE